MVGRHTVRAEIEEQRCLIEQQQVEILRQRHQLEMQRRHMAHLEAELEAIKATFQSGAPTLRTHSTPSNGNGNGNGHGAVPHLRSETGASGD